MGQHLSFVLAYASHPGSDSGRDNQNLHSRTIFGALFTTKTQRHQESF